MNAAFMLFGSPVGAVSFDCWLWVAWFICAWLVGTVWPDLCRATEIGPVHSLFVTPKESTGVYLHFCVLFQLRWDTAADPLVWQLILDSGAIGHMTGMCSSFISYTDPIFIKFKLHMDLTFCERSGTRSYNSEFPLSSLHVPGMSFNLSMWSFTNLLSHYVFKIWGLFSIISLECFFILIEWEIKESIQPKPNPTTPPAPLSYPFKELGTKNFEMIQELFSQKICRNGKASLWAPFLNPSERKILWLSKQPFLLSKENFFN